MIFRQWLPIGFDQGLQVKSEPYIVTVWLDLSPAKGAFGITEEEISRTINVFANHIFVDAQVSGLDDELLDYMAYRDFSR